MRIPITIALATAIMLGGCGKDTAAPEGTPFTQDHMVLQSQIVKVKSDDWEAYGTPGDDVHGLSVKLNVHVIDESIANDGVVRVQLQRSKGNWLELPVTMDQGGPKNMNWRFDHWAGAVRVRIDRNGAAVEPPDEILTFRVLAGARQ